MIDTNNLGRWSFAPPIKTRVAFGACLLSLASACTVNGRPDPGVTDGFGGSNDSGGSTQAGGATSSGGSDGGNDGVPTYDGNLVYVTPEMDLQAVVDEAQAGDVILLAPGTYYQSIVVEHSGTAEEPIVIAAENPGTATISGATPPDVDLQFTQLDGDLYRASVGWTVRWVMADGRNLMGYNDRQGLENFMVPGHDSNNAEQGPPEGFAWEDGDLYVRLLNGQDPNTAKLEIHRSFSGAASPPLNTAFFGDRAYPSSAYDALDDPAGANITVRGSHVIIAGLRLHLGPLSGIKVAADDVKIHDCYFDGQWRSIRAGGSARVTVEYNEFSGYPSYQWVRWGAQNGAQWALWNAIYNTNLNINHVHHYGPSFKLNHNLVYEGFDCLWPRNMGDLDPAHTSDYSYNRVMSCGDECIEFDTREPINLRVHHNFFMDATAVLALSPVQGGGLMIDHNIAYISPEYGLNSSVLFKFDCPWCGGSNNGPTQGVTIAHNTLVNSKNRLYWTGENHAYEQCIAENNIFYTQRESGWVHQDFTLSEYNLHSGPRMEPGANHMSQCIHADDPDFVSAPSMESGALIGGEYVELPVVPYQSTLPTSQAPKVDFRLQAGGISVDAGNPEPALDAQYHHSRNGSAPDLGAIEHGEDWNFTPGPRWAVGAKKPWRPPLPPSLDPKWAGSDP